MAKIIAKFSQVQGCITDVLILQRGLSLEQAGDFAEVAVSGIKEKFKGGAIYVPTGREERIERRNWLIWEEFDGHNYEELARKYSNWDGLGELTARQVYNIIDDIRPLAISKIQGDLFE